MKQKEIEQLFRKHYARMTRLARTLIYDDEEARDVVSEVFATLIKTDIAPKNTEGYLLMSVRNRCMNLLEHKSVRAKFEQAYIIEIKSDDEPMLKTDASLRWTSPNGKWSIIAKGTNIFNTHASVRSTLGHQDYTMRVWDTNSPNISLTAIHRIGNFKEKKKKAVDTSRMGY